MKAAMFHFTFFWLLGISIDSLTASAWTTSNKNVQTSSRNAGLFNVQSSRKLTVDGMSVLNGAGSRELEIEDKSSWVVITFSGQVQL
jgi:hypothetical protein